jgi:dihydropyrimidine dehydrogenase (NAD+) subunit PreT
MEEAARCLLCHDAPCSAACPAGTDPGRFIRSIRFRNPKGAAETVRENNVIGGSCAWVCPYDNFCEEACSRCGIDRPIEIGRLQRYVVEQEQVQKMKILKPPAKKKGVKVACVGAGPASLACAAELAKAGYAVTIFEAEEKAGGVLTYGITPARLPQGVVDQDVAAIRGLGVRFALHTRVGADISLDALREQGFAAFFLGAGLWKAQLPDIEGTDLAGVYAASGFLKTARESRGRTGLAGKRAVVVGGGDVAMDCATTAKLTGAAHVAVYYRRTLEEAPANMREIQYALSLGISIVTNFAPVRCVGADGKLQYVEFKGRDGNSSAQVAADAAVFAIGQAPQDMRQLADLSLTEKGTVKTRSGGKTNLPDVFAAGDVANGGKTVVEAVAEGKKAAAAICKRLDALHEGRGK